MGRTDPDTASPDAQPASFLGWRTIAALLVWGVAVARSLGLLE